MFNKYWKKHYINEVERSNEYRIKLENFKSEVFKEEVIQDQKKEITRLEHLNTIYCEKYNVLNNCNQTLTQALNNITKR